MNKFIPLSVPNLSELEKKYLIEAVNDGWVSSVGPHVKKFEEDFANFIGVSNAIACSSGTAALHVALIIKGVETENEVLLPNISFVATANVVSYVGAVPVFLDIDSSNLGISTESLISFLEKYTVFDGEKTINKITGRVVKAILPVHMLGTPVNIDELNEICSKYKIEVIEDAAESLGSRYKNKLTGSLSEIACFSFNGNKIMTTGGGGMITTNNSKLASKAKHLTTTAKSDPIFFNHDKVGYNYRMVNVLAALGLAQMSRLKSFIEIKHNTHKLYSKLLYNIKNVNLFTAPEGYESNYWLNMITFDESILKKYSLKDLIDFFIKKGIQTRPLWTQLSELPMYKNCFSMPIKKSKSIHTRSLTIPSSTNIKDYEIEYVVKTIKEII